MTKKEKIFVLTFIVIYAVLYPFVYAFFHRLTMGVSNP